MRQSAIGFYPNKHLMLEGVLTTPDGLPSPYPALLVCHHHPALGGEMEHPLMMAICRAADNEGIATLRFNFRGVGGSQGTFTNGTDELKDLRSALKTLRSWPGIHRGQTVVVGYSFGASVVLSGLGHCKAARGLAFIAPPVSSVTDSKIGSDRRPRLFVAGGDDRVSPSADLQRALDEMRQPVRFMELQNAGHGLEGRAEEVGKAVTDFALETLGYK